MVSEEMGLSRAQRAVHTFTTRKMLNVVFLYMQTMLSVKRRVGNLKVKLI